MTQERVAVIGTGYVGLVTGACLAHAGNQVTCHDIAADRIEALRAGGIPIHEPGLEAVVHGAVEAGRLAFTSDLVEALDGATIAMLAVGTPQGDDGAADLTFLDQAFDQVVAACADGALVIIRSTVPPGTGDRLQARADNAGKGIDVVNAPEFLAEGTAVRDFQHPDRLVFGGRSKATERALALWADVEPEAPRRQVARVTAELSKYAANTFLAARVSLINEMANLCDTLGGDVRELADIVGLDGRIGPGFLRAGIGYGGSCFPKDVQALVAVAEQAGVDVPVARAVEATNHAQWRRVAEQIQVAVAGTPSPRVAILGAAFKPGTDDRREAPGLKIAAKLREAGIAVTVHDPVAAADEADILRAADGAHVLLHATEWPEYNGVDWSAVASTMAGDLVIDGRNTLDWGIITAAGLRVQGIGAKPPQEVLA